MTVHRFSKHSLAETIDAPPRRAFRFFWHPEAAPTSQAPTRGCLSQWSLARFEVAGLSYPSAEHFMMAEKARLFRDEETRARILAAAGPDEVKALGRQVREARVRRNDTARRPPWRRSMMRCHRLDDRRTLVRFMTPLLATFVLLSPVVGHAETKCRQDTFGNTVCTDDRGNTTRGHRDTFGNDVWTDGDGRTTRGRTDTFGNKVYTDDRGNTVRGTHDTFGNERWEDRNGGVVRGRTDTFGNKVYTDDHGNTILCTRDTFGNRVCK